MAARSEKNFVRKMNIPRESLIDNLQESTADIETNEDQVTDEAQQALLHSNLQFKDVFSKKIISFSEIENAKHLSELNGLLTFAMTNRTIQSLLKGDRLESVINFIFNLSKKHEDELTVAAILGRLAAVARTRESIIFDQAEKIFSSQPDSIETLSDGDTKLYAATIISKLSNAWVSEYSYRESFRIDTADKARKKLLSANLNQEKNIARWLENIIRHAKQHKIDNSPEIHLKRARRISCVMFEIIDSWNGEIGENVGERISECLITFLPENNKSLNPNNLYDVVDYHLSILKRVIELRLSNALYPSTYASIVNGKRQLGLRLWRNYISQSKVLPIIRIVLLESALVLARQNRSDKDIIMALTTSYHSRSQVSMAIKKHFEDAKDLDPDVADWWKGNDRVSVKSVTQQKVGNSEDSQIGILLIELDGNREAIEKVGRTVVPLLSISDPVLSSTVNKAVNGYKSVEQTARRLARMRKLTKMDLKGARLEYNPLEHEMLGGHRPGVREVKVVRDGIRKKFSGKTKTLIKPWVEPT